MFAGTVVEFTPAADVEVYLAPSKVGKQECQVIGWTYFDIATGAQKGDLDAMLNEFGPTLMKRCLRSFANYAKRTNQKDVAEYAEMLRDEIQFVRAAKSA